MSAAVPAWPPDVGWSPGTRLYELQPEMRLALAVLDDAVRILRTMHGVDTTRARVLAAETWRWVTSEETSSPFAFRWICQHLAIDAAWLRAGLARWRPSSGRAAAVVTSRGAA